MRPMLLKLALVSFVKRSVVASVIAVIVVVAVVVVASKISINFYLGFSTNLLTSPLFTAINLFRREVDAVFA
jgi:hypothetical protein